MTLAEQIDHLGQTALKIKAERSAFWRALRLWAEDNEEAANVREDRRALRRIMRTIDRPAQLDPGMEVPR